MKLNRTLTALVAVAGLGLSTQASAAMTKAGETISNSINISYTVGGGAPITSSQDANFVVDRKVDMELQLQTTIIEKTELAASGVDTFVVFKYTLNNSGNLDQDFLISLADTSSTSVIDTTPDPDVTYVDDATFSPVLTTNYKVYDSDPTAGPKPAAISDAEIMVEAATNKNTPLSTSKEFWIEVKIPETGFSDKDIAVLEAIATASNGSAAAIGNDNGDDKNTTGNLAQALVVFADGVDASAVANTSFNGKVSSYIAIQFEVGSLIDPDGENPGDPGYTGPLLEVEVVNDPICDNDDPATAVVSIDSTPATCTTATYKPKAIPGAVVEFTFSVTNSGTGTAKSLSVDKTLTDEYEDTSLKYVAGSAKNNNVVLVTDPAVTEAVASSGIFNKITTNFGDLSGGHEAIVKYRAILK